MMLWARNQLQAISIPLLLHHNGSRASGQCHSWKGLASARWGKTHRFTSPFKPGLSPSLCSESNMKQQQSLVPQCQRVWFLLHPWKCVYIHIYVYKYTSLIWKVIPFIDTEREGQTFSIVTETSGIRPQINLVWDLRRLDHILAVVAVTTLPWCLAS